MGNETGRCLSESHHALREESFALLCLLFPTQPQPLWPSRQLCFLVLSQKNSVGLCKLVQYLLRSDSWEITYRLECLRGVGD